MHRCNWKMLVDNQTDTCHPMVAHESSAGTAVKVWEQAPAGTPKPMAVEPVSYTHLDVYKRQFLHHESAFSVPSG